MSHLASGYDHYELLSLCASGLRDASEEQLSELLRQAMIDGLHGIAFSPYVGGQGPGTQLEAPQIRARLELIAPYVSWIRTFSCTEGNDLIPGIARDFGLKTMVGVWLDDDLENNEIELARGIELAQQGQADILAIGNEVLLREDLPEDALVDYMERARSQVKDVPIGYVDAYFKFVDHPGVTRACDVILANCYPFWEGCSETYALLYLQEMYRRVSAVADGRRVIVSETGWPNAGTAVGDARPSRAAAMRYFLKTWLWARDEDIDLFYFSAFDEDWKVDKEGDVGAYWGLLDSRGTPKYYAQ